MGYCFVEQRGNNFGKLVLFCCCHGLVIRLYGLYISHSKLRRIASSCSEWKKTIEKYTVWKSHKKEKPLHFACGCTINLPCDWIGQMVWCSYMQWSYANSSSPQPPNPVPSWFYRIAGSNLYTMWQGKAWWWFTASQKCS